MFLKCVWHGESWQCIKCLRELIISYVNHVSFFQMCTTHTCKHMHVYEAGVSICVYAHLKVHACGWEWMAVPAYWDRRRACVYFGVFKVIWFLPLANGVISAAHLFAEFLKMVHNRLSADWKQPVRHNWRLTFILISFTIVIQIQRKCIYRLILLCLGGVRKLYLSSYPL